MQVIGCPPSRGTGLRGRPQPDGNRPPGLPGPLEAGDQGGLGRLEGRGQEGVEELAGTVTVVNRRPKAKTLASFHRRAPWAVDESVHSAARTPGTLLAAIATPVPVVQHTTPRSTWPAATASPTNRPASGQSRPSATTRTSWPRWPSMSTTASVSAVRSSVPKATSMPSRYPSPRVARDCGSATWAGQDGAVTVTVRRAGSDEWRLLRALRLAALADSPEAFGSTLERESAFSDDQWGPWLGSLHWFVAEEGGRAVGLVAAAGQDRRHPGRRQVLSMWVAPPARRHGVGAALVGAVRTWAVEGGARALTLGVAEGNEGARRFYEHLGFGPTGAREPTHRDPDRHIDEYQLAL